MKPSPFMTEWLSEDKFILYWPKIKRELEKVPHIWQPWWTLESIYDFTVHGRFQCWAVGTEDEVRGIAFSQVASYPRQDVLQVFMAFGDGMLDMVDELEAAFYRFALARNCGMAEITGRPGWESVMRRRGFRRANTTLVRNIVPMEVN